jgi:alpha-tubulin suppressor-like RCC1 family protein
MATSALESHLAASILSLQGLGVGPGGIVLGFLGGVAVAALAVLAHNLLQGARGRGFDAPGSEDEGETDRGPLFFTPEDERPPSPISLKRIGLLLALLLAVGVIGATLVRVVGSAGREASLVPTARLPGTVSPRSGERPFARPDSLVLSGDSLVFVGDSGVMGVDSTGRPGVPARLVVLEGDGQEGEPGNPLPSPLSVRVVDAVGQPVRGAIVLFNVESGGGRVGPPAVGTGPDGVARANWILGSGAELNVVSASVEGFAGPPVRFRAVYSGESPVEPGAPARLALVRGGGQEGEPGQPLAEAILVQVLDEGGNPVGDAPVAFEVTEGAGQISRATGRTNPRGFVQTEWSLGPEEGRHSLSVTIPDMEGSLVVTATAAAARLGTRAAIVAGGTHTCSLSADGTSSCWGGNESGQLGDGGTSRRTTPSSVAAPVQFSSLSAGISHTCGVSVTGEAYCWGSNDRGQLGDGTSAPKATPVRVATEVSFVSVDAGISHTCGIARGGAAYCWGSNLNGELGDGTNSDRSTPVRVGGGLTFRSIVVGWTHSCGLTSQGIAHCWGRNGFGQLGDGSGSDRSTPVQVVGGRSYAAIAAGSTHTCAIQPARNVFCWGQNTYGQLGDGTTTDQMAPVRILGSAQFASVVAGGVHTCALTTDGAAYCWGRNTYGQLGDGSTTDRAQPVPVEGALRFSSLYASGAHTCGISRDGLRYCWGYNVEGQLGDGTRTNRSSPTRVGS